MSHFAYTDFIPSENLTSSLYGVLQSDKLHVSSFGLTSTLTEGLRAFLERPPIQQASVVWNISSLTLNSTIFQSTCESYLSTLSSAYLQIPFRFTGILESQPSPFLLGSTMQISTFSVNSRIHVSKAATIPLFSSLTDILQFQIPVQNENM
jgi:hypothetical protein